MFTRLAHGNIDKAKWDACITRSTMPLPYAFSWFLDVASPGWDALVTSDYEFIMPLTQRRKFNTAYLYQPYFTQQLGIFSELELTRDIAQACLNALVEDFRLIEINFNYGNGLVEELKPVGKNNGTTNWETRITHHLDLSKTYDELFNGFTSSRKRDINKLKQSGLAVREETNGDWLIKMFDKNKQGVLKKHDYELLKRIMNAAIKHNCGTVYAAYENNERIAGHFLLHNGRYVINLFATSNARGRETQAMPLLLNNALQTFSGSNKIFDFEGSQIESIAKFFASFGGVRVPYWMLRYNALPWPTRILKRLKDGH